MNGQCEQQNGRAERLAAASLPKPIFDISDWNVALDILSTEGVFDPFAWVGDMGLVREATTMTKKKKSGSGSINDASSMQILVLRSDAATLCHRRCRRRRCRRHRCHHRPLRRHRHR